MLAMLDNATDIGYTLKHNDLWTGTFSLPAGDPKNEYCAAHNLVMIPDGGRNTGFYRIVSMPSSNETALGGKKTYNVEHVIATLLDDVLFGYHEVGGGVNGTAEVIRYILAHQIVGRWVLGTCDFTDYYQYHFENVSLLSALLSMGEVLTEEYTWQFDTTTNPWTVNLVRADSEPGCGIHYWRNLIDIEKTMDASALITRLYPLGYGEGVNQLTVRDVNNGLPYIDADTAQTWGIKASVWTDTRIEDPALLLARGRQVLEGYKNPYITYKAKALDLYRLTGYDWDNVMPGKLVTVQDAEHNISFKARVVEIQKSNVNGDPGSQEITIANAPRDAADSINTLADRVGIGELYSQGATNLFAVPFADNADENHPAKMRVYVPSGLVRINKMLLSWQLRPFRAYETAAAAGGETTKTSSSGGASTQTTASTETVTYTSETGGSCTATSESTTVSIYGLGQTGGPETRDGAMNYRDDLTGDLTTGEAGSHSHTADSYQHGVGHVHAIESHSHTVDSHVHGLNDHTHSLNNHNHTTKWGHSHVTPTTFTPGDNTGGVANYQTLNPNTGNATGNTGASAGDTEAAAPGTSSIMLVTGGAYSGDQPMISTGSAAPNTDSQGAHTHTVPATHHHGFWHKHTIQELTIPALTVDVPNHGHNVKIPGHSHSVSIPAHTHDITLPSHTHNITYGIFEGTTAQSVSIVVDGATVPPEAITGGELDVVQWLDKDADGKITRNAWHEIQIVPNTLTRIEASLFAQCFIQSVGGGDY